MLYNTKDYSLTACLYTVLFKIEKYILNIRIIEIINYK